MSYKRIVAEQEEFRKYNEDRESRILKLAEENIKLKENIKQSVIEILNEEFYEDVDYEGSPYLVSNDYGKKNNYIETIAEKILKRIGGK